MPLTTAIAAVGALGTLAGGAAALKGAFSKPKSSGGSQGQIGPTEKDKKPKLLKTSLISTTPQGLLNETPTGRTRLLGN